MRTTWFQRCRVTRALRLAAIGLLGLIGGCRCGKDDRPPSIGRFEPAMPEVVLLTDGQNARLLKDFAYIESVPGEPPTERRWDVPAGATVDGASIPRLFWTLVSGPWEGQYRYASIVHDRYCCRPAGRTWRQTHRMFYDACVTGGTEVWRAKLMYAAVFHFGPTWDDGAKTNPDSCVDAREGAGEGTESGVGPSMPPMLRAGTGENARRRAEALQIFAAERPAVVAQAAPVLTPDVGIGPATPRPTTMAEVERAWRRAVLAPRPRRAPLAPPTSGRRDALETWEEVKRLVGADENVSLEALEAVRPEP